MNYVIQKSEGYMSRAGDDYRPNEEGRKELS